MENPKHDEIIHKLDEELTYLKSQSTNVLCLTEKAMTLCKCAIQGIREDVILKGFESTQSEIYFFKQVKPKLNSKLIFYIRLFKIETHRLDSCKMCLCGT